MTDSHGRRYGKASRITKKSTTPTPVAAVMPRSVSMSTLPTLSVESLKPRISCLESLEAKMANIEVSLSNDHQPRKKNSQNNRMSSNNKYEVGQLQLHDINLANEKMTKLIKEIETLRKGVLEKDALITELKKQNVMLEQEKQNKENGERESQSQPAVKKTDVELKQERLKEIQKEIDDKQAIIKNLQLSMDKMEANDLDGRIHQAELEFQQEREELDLLNLQQEHLAVKAFIEEKTVETKIENNVKNVTFFSLLKYNRCATLVAVEVPYNPQSPHFVIAAHSSGRGLFVQWSRENSSLKKGDRLVEVNGHFLLNCTREDLIVILSKTSITIPLQVTVLRNTPQSSARWVNACELENLKDEVASVINKLDAKNRENKNLQVVIEKLKSENGKFQKDNLKLSHRIMYLEDQVGDLQRSWEDLRSTLNQADLSSARSFSSSNFSTNKNSKQIIRIEDNNSFHSLPYQNFSENPSIRRSGSMGRVMDRKSPSLLKNFVSGTTSISVNQSKTTTSSASINSHNSLGNTRNNYGKASTISHSNTNGCDFVSNCKGIPHEHKSLQCVNYKERFTSNDIFQDDSDSSEKDVIIQQNAIHNEDNTASFTSKSKSMSCVPLYLNSQTKETNPVNVGLPRKQNPLCSSKSTSHIGSIHKKTIPTDCPPPLNVRVLNSPIMKSHSFGQLDHISSVVSKGNAHILQVHVPFSQSNAVEHQSLLKSERKVTQSLSHPTVIRTNSSSVAEPGDDYDLSSKHSFHLHEDNSVNLYKETAEINLKPSTMPFHLKMNHNKIALDDFESDHEQWC